MNNHDSNQGLVNSMALSETRDCPLCNAQEATQLAQMTAQQIINSSAYYDDAWYQRLGVEPESLYGVCECDRCHFVFSSKVPSDSFLEQIYGYSDSIEKSVATFARPSRAAFAYRSLAKLLEAIDQRVQQDDRGMVSDNVKLLDVGCAYGAGSLGLAVKHYPYDISGVEWSQITRDYLTEQGMQTYKTIEDIEDIHIFDGIILNDVLEHVADPLAFVSQLRQHCHQATAVWVNVPDFIEWRLQDVLSKVKEGSMNVPKDMNPWEHLSYFSPQTLNELMARAGFKRMAAPFVEYKIQRGSLLASIKVLVRTLRDSWRIYRGGYPDDFSTSGIFVLDNRSDA